MIAFQNDKKKRRMKVLVEVLVELHKSARSSCHVGLRMRVSVSLLGQDELEHVALLQEIPADR